MAQDTLLGFPAHILPYRFLDSLRQGKHLPFRPVLTSFWKGALLVGAETEKEGQIVLSMTSTEADVLQQEGNFTLPDGTVLYEPDSG